MNVEDILKNDTIKGLLDKFGVSGDQAKSVANQAMNSVKSKFDKNPKQMSSLLSENDNTDDDKKLATEVEDDFVSGLISKVGLPENIAGQLKSAIPGILSQFTGKLSADGKNDEGGIAGMFSSVVDMFDGDDNTKGGSKKSGASGLMGLFGKFFGKK